MTRKEIRLGKLMYSGFDLEYYIKDPNCDVHIQEYNYTPDDDFIHIGWETITDFDYEKYKYHFVDSIDLYDGGGFRLRISMPPRRIEKFRVFLLKLFRR